MKNSTLTTIGLGTFPFSNVFSPVIQKEAERIIHEYIQLGGNYIETAPIYPINGINLGEIISQVGRDNFIIGTKCALGLYDGKVIKSGKLNFLKQQVEDEITRLNIDCIDLIQTHITPTDVSIEELGENLNVLMNTGLVKSVGCSNISLSDLKRLKSVCDISWVQVRLSLIHRFEHAEIAEFCQLNGIGINAFQVIERGQFSLSSSNTRLEGDLRNSKQEYIGDADDIVSQWYVQISERLIDFGIDPNLFPIQWALSQEAVKSVVVGATRIEQLQQNMQAAILLPLRPEVLKFAESCFEDLEAMVEEKYNCSLRQLRGVERQS